MNSIPNRSNSSQLHHSFSELGTKYQLAFSSQLNLPGMLVGIDGIRRKMLVVSTGEAMLEWKLVDLPVIRDCTLLKTYEPILAGALNSFNADSYIHEISVRILTVNSEEILLPFYIKNLHDLKDLPRISKTAQAWHHMILKLLPQPLSA